MLRSPFTMAGVYKFPDILTENSWAVEINFLNIDIFLRRRHGYRSRASVRGNVWCKEFDVCSVHSQDEDFPQRMASLGLDSQPHPQLPEKQIYLPAQGQHERPPGQAQHRLHQGLLV